MKVRFISAINLTAITGYLVIALTQSAFASEAVTKIVSSKLKCYCEGKLNSNKYSVEKAALKNSSEDWVIEERAQYMSLIKIPASINTDFSDVCKIELANGVQNCWAMHSAIKPAHKPKSHANNDVKNATCKEQGVQMGAGSC